MQEPYSEVRPEDYYLWSCPDHDASEFEVTDFLYALTYMVKPKVVVEVGTHLGHTAYNIGCALKRNCNNGVLHTFEIDEAKVLKARNKVRSLPVVVHAKSAMSKEAHEFVPVQPDILFIDCNLDNREFAYASWLPRVKEGGYILIHDSLKYDPPKTFIESIKLPRITFHTPRGLTMFQKVEE